MGDPELVMGDSALVMGDPGVAGSNPGCLSDQVAVKEIREKAPIGR